MKYQNNKTIRETAKAANYPTWKVAEILNISENTLFRRLRKELPADEQEAIAAKIRAHAAGSGEGNGHE